MMKRLFSVLVCALLLFGSAVGASATAYEPYEGSFSTTYITYFRDILAGRSIQDNYVAFRSGQYEYIMVTGKMVYDGNTFTLTDTGKMFKFSATDTGYNSLYTYEVTDITEFTLSPNRLMIYSDLGEYPQLEERTQRYEILTAIMLGIIMLSFVIGRFFRWGVRR